MLFGQIDANFSVYKWDKLHRIGLTPATPMANRVTYDTDLRSGQTQRNDVTYQFCVDAAKTVFNDNNLAAARYAARSCFKTLGKMGLEPRERQAFFREVLISNYDEAIAEIARTGEAEEVRSRLSNDNLLVQILVIAPFFQALASLFESYVEGLYFASKQGGAFASNLFPSNMTLNQRIDPATEALRVARFDFAKQITLPSPKNLSEAIELRSTAQIRRLREVLNEWCVYIEAGDQKRHHKMAGDVNRATSDLRKLKNVSDFRVQKYFITLNVIGSFIPLFSNVLTAMNVGLEIYQNKVGYRTSWVGR